MNADDARALAVRYKNIWRGGPSVDELIAAFTTLESHAIAADMLTHAAAALEHPPTIRTLHERYHASRNGQRVGIPKPEYTGEPVALADIIELDDLEPLRRLRAGEYGTRRRHPTSNR